RLRRAISAASQRRPAQARRARAGARAQATLAADGRAVRLARCHRAAAHRAGPRRSRRARAHPRAARDARSRGGAEPLRRRLSALAGAAGPCNAALSGADPAAAQRRARSHACRVRTALRALVARSLPRGGRRMCAGGGVMLLDPARAWMRQLLAFAILLAIWEAAGRAGLLNPLYFPS